MATRPRNNNSGNTNSGNTNSGNPAKRGRAIKLHGITCGQIMESLGDIVKDQELLKKILDKIPEDGEYRNKTALYSAVFDKNPAVVECLLALGADPNIMGDINTPIYIAAYYGQTEIVSMLMLKGADPLAGRIYDSKNFSPLYVAVEKGHIPVVTLLLEDSRVRVNINVPLADTETYFTPLIIAVLQGQKEIVDLLKEKGAKLMPPHIAYTPHIFQKILADACYEKRIKQVKMLLEPEGFAYLKGELELKFDGLDVNYVIKNDSLLYTACSVDDNWEIAKYLFDMGARLTDVESEVLTTEHRGGTFEQYKEYLVTVETQPPTGNNNTPRAGGGAARKSRKQRRTRKNRKTRKERRTRKG